MTSKEALEKLIESILEQEKIVTARPDLILNINVEYFIPIIQRACEELDKVEELKRDIVTTYESNKLLREENTKLKKVIEILKDYFEIWLNYEEEENLFFEDKSLTIVKDDVLSLLVSKPNVIITSHQAFLTEEALEQIALTTLFNLDEYFASKPLTNEVCCKK